MWPAGRAHCAWGAHFVGCVPVWVVSCAWVRPLVGLCCVYARLGAVLYAQPEMAQTPYPQTDRALMRLIERSPNHRAGYKQLIRELGLGGGRERRLLLEQLARITARGELVKIDSEQWSLPSAAPEKTKRAPRGGVEMPVEHRVTRDR